MHSLKRKLDDLRRPGKAKGQKKISFGLPIMVAEMLEK